jgi:hypothetical protein
MYYNELIKAQASAAQQGIGGGPPVYLQSCMKPPAFMVAGRLWRFTLVALSPAPHEGAAQTTAAFESTSPAMPKISTQDHSCMSKSVILLAPRQSITSRRPCRRSGRSSWLELVP